jgi:predicted dehydrogenase
VTGLELRRADFYEKELTFQVSCSYGPGRYDENYEQKGQDYPFGFVRWTEQRNFEAVLDLMARKKLDVQPLVTHRFPFEDAPQAYELISKGKEPYLGIILEYQRAEHQNTDDGRRMTDGGDQGLADGGLRSEGGSRQVELFSRTVQLSESIADKKFPFSPESLKLRPQTSNLTPVVGIIGAGNFTGSVLLPALKRTGVRLKGIASSGGVTGTYLGKKFGFEASTTEIETIFSDPEIKTVFITTRHNTHARLVLEALKAGKNIFVEKPLCLNIEELKEIELTYSSLLTLNPALNLMVGFNRRFSPHLVKIKGLLAGRTEPLTMSMTVNAGSIPPEHWAQDPERGGGRIIGEGCHFIDLLSFLAEAPVTAVSARMVGGHTPVREDKMSILFGFADGSVGTVNYFANGAKSYPKETLEVFGDGRVIRMENFRTTTGYGFKGFRSFRTWRQDKGHRAEIAAFVNAVAAGGAPLIPFEQIVNISRASFAAVESARTGRTVEILQGLG